MKTTFLAAALCAFAAAAPADARNWSADNAEVQQLQVRIDSGMKSGAIAGTSGASLMLQLHQLRELERRYSRRGFSERESMLLQQQSSSLGDSIARAERRTDGFDWSLPSDWGPMPGSVEKQN